MINTNMQNITKIFAIALVLAFVTTVAIPTTFAANKKFEKNLSYGIKNNAEVKSLQEVLSKKGYLKTAPTGNFLMLTTEAVKAFQKANNIQATGFVGPLTRAALNAETVDALLSITSHNGGGKVEVGQKQAITWTSSNYNSDSVVINILKKVSDNPNRYELVRSISGDISNDGSATWIPAKSDIGSTIVVEVGCKNSTTACNGTLTASTLAVIDSSRFSNTASAFDAIEKADNK